MTRKLITPEWNDRKHMDKLVKDGESIVGAFSRWGREILTVDDSTNGTLYIYENEDRRAVVRADSFESALEAVYDELPAIDKEDVPEAYGFDSEDEMRAAEENPDHEWNLVDGYTCQANATGTGIVWHGHSEQLTPIEPETFEELKISLLIEIDDDEE
jgi:hypothetical protein